MAKDSKNKGRIPSSTNSLSEEADKALTQKGPAMSVTKGTAKPSTDGRPGG